MNYKVRILAAIMAGAMLLSACSSRDKENSSSVPVEENTTSSVVEGEVTSNGETLPPSSGVASGTTSTSSEPPKVVNPYEGLKTYQEKLTKAKTINKDVKAWLSVPGTTIDAPVLQAANNDYYLKLDEYKNYSIFGCYYFDYENSLTARSNLSKNTIIYGHSDLKDNANGPRFSQLFKYLDKDFLSKNANIHMSIAGEDMVFQIFSVFYTHTNFNYIKTNPSEADFQAIIEGANQRNQFITDVTVGANDKILTLSTCSANYNPNDKNNYRLVVMAKLLPAGNNGGNISVSVNPNPLKS